VYVGSCVLAVSHGHSISVKARTHAQPFYGPFSETTRVSQCQKKSSGLYGAREDKYADNPAGRHSIRTNQRPTSIVPPFLHEMPFLPEPSQFILAWYRHQVCWLAYRVAWLRHTWAQTHTDTNTHRHKHTQTQTHKHTDTQTHTY